MYYFSNTTQFFLFETIVFLIIISSFFLAYRKMQELFALSLQKGIRYFADALFFFTISFSVEYVKFLMLYFFNVTKSLSLAFGFISIYCAILGGFYLGYSLIWRKFEKDRIKRVHLGKTTILHFFVIFITFIEIALINKYSTSYHNYLFYTLMIAFLTFAIIHSQSCCKRHTENAPFLASAVMALGIFISLFAESLLVNIFPFIHYYVWGLIAVFIHAVYHNVTTMIEND